MAAQVRCARIIWCEIADGNGVSKASPAVVITPDDKITPAGQIQVVAITSTLPSPLPDDHVLLPWHA